MKRLIPVFTAAVLFSGVSISAESDTYGYTVTDNYYSRLSELCAQGSLSIEAAEQSGENSAVKDPYYSGRIAVTADPDAAEDIYTDDFGAEEALTSPFGIRVLQYGTPSEAREACGYLNTIDGVNAVPDVTFELFETDETGYLWGDHIGWGAEFIKSDIFNERYLSAIGSLDNAKTVNVAVIDSGVDHTHPLLSGRIDTEKGYDLYDGDSDTMDENSHGTHVAGIICDNTLPNVRIIPYKITNGSRQTTLSRLMEALKMAANDGADIVNLSLGSEDPELSVKRTLEPYIEKLEEKGITVVVSSGNYSMDAAKVSPANIESCITVSACKSGGVFDAEYSDYGEVIDVCAPGTDVNSTIPGGGYGIKSGTSMAAPYVTAAAAMIISADNDLSASEVERLITENAEDAGAEGFDVLYGHGLLDMENTADSLFGAQAEESQPAEAEQGFAEPVSQDGSVRVTLKNIEAREDGAVIAAASYKSGELFSIGTAEIDPNEEISDVEREVTLDHDGCDTVKLFLLESLDSLTPICKAYTQLCDCETVVSQSVKHR